ncbi:putative lipoprotein [Enterococcus faecalis AZ19]|uniref:EF0163 family protein n=1 Tax=Enterococcus TaxID=1350 RepID=UPI00045A1218|nr:EF0163 family protein [Enterococcus faecalis]KAJ72892.1 putative lipoprotein [Enterococcus faecalis AZ19]
MKKLNIVGLLLGVGLVFTACGGSTRGHETLASSTTETVTMKPVDDINSTKKSEVTEKSSTKSMQSKDKLAEEKVSGTYQLVEDFGNAYANFSSINDRNEKLKKLMTAECIKKNGIDVKTGAKLESKGEVSSIYQNDKKEYAVLLDCEQNGTKTKVLLLAKVKDNTVAEMTYNSLKQEY